MSNYWEVSCVDQRFDDEGFELGRSVQGKDGKWRYEVHPCLFVNQKDAMELAKTLNKEIKK